MDSGRQALVLGATGGIGGEVARRLVATGWRVRALKRGVAALPQQQDGIDWVRGDAMNGDQVLRAAQGCSVIVHAVNPPGYRRWGELVLPMVDNTIAAAEAVGARIVLPGTVYNYGPDAFPLLSEDSPQQPLTRKGAIRVEMERRLREAAARGRARVLVVRAGDFFGPQAGNSWFSQGLVKPGKPVSAVFNPSTPGVGHQWAYLPDVAQTMVALLQREAALEPFAAFHMAGHWDHDGQRMAGAVAKVVERRTGRRPSVKRFPWWVLPLAAPFVPVMRELMEMRYLWREPVQLENTKLQALLGQEPHTPLERAVEATLQGLGCLPAPQGRGGAAATPA